MIFVQPALAQCPVCIVTVGGGLLIAKKFGIDDVLVSLWIGGLNTVIALFLASKFKNKLLKNPYFLSVLFLVLTLITFQTTNQFGPKSNSLLGINKVVLGQTLGTILVILGYLIDKFIRLKNNNKVIFYYQKVVFPVGLLLLFTLIFKLIFKL
jgi:hypothetical protein